MFPGTTGWAISLGVILIVWIVLFIRRGPTEALAPAILLSLAFPVWLKFNVLDMPFSLRTATAAIAMLAYAAHPRGRILSPLTMLDFCIAFMCCAHIVTDYWHDGPSISLPFRAYGEWALPYVAGRYAIKNQQDMLTAAKWAAGILVFLSIMAIIEAVTKINGFELMFGERPEELANRNSSRLGFRRAYATAMHPIYFGMLLAVLTPWIACLLEKRESVSLRIFAVLAVIITTLGLLATFSRTPIVTVVGSSVFLMAVMIRKLRIPIATVVISAVAVFLIWPYQVADFIGKHTFDENQRLVEVDGAAVVYSASRSRLLLPVVYAKAMVNAGVVGYGSEATKAFPLNIPYLEGTAETKDALKLVDNAHVLTILRFGWLGGFFMELLLFTAIISSWSLYLWRPDRIFPIAVTGLLILYSLISLNLVSQVYDFAFVVIWTIGIISGQCSQRLETNQSLVSSSRFGGKSRDRF